MPLSPELLALASALLVSIASLMVRQGLRWSNFYSGYLISVLVGVGVVWIALAIFRGPEPMPIQTIPIFILSGLLGTAGGRLLRFASMEKLGVSIAVPITNTNPLVSTLLAILFLGERVTYVIILGTILIITGVSLLSIGGGRASFKPLLLIYPLSSAILFGLVAILRKIGLAEADPFFGTAINVTTALGFYAGFLLASGSIQRISISKRSLGHFFGAGVFENSAVLLYFMALSSGDVSIVAPLSSAHPLFLLILVFVFLKGVERLTPRIVLGALLTVLGVLLIVS